MVAKLPSGSFRLAQAVPANISFEVDGYAAAQLQRQARRDCEDGIVHVRGGQFHRLV